LVQVGEGISAWRPAPGRMGILNGLRGTTIIDDSYNASPAAALASIDALEQMQIKDGADARKIMMLGDMLELGTFAGEAHKMVGERAAEVVDLFITVGIRARAAAEAAMDGGLHPTKVRQYDAGEAERAAEELEVELQEGDVVLIKGSAAMRMERAVKAIMAEPQRSSELLVRQEPEWLAKS